MIHSVTANHSSFHPVHFSTGLNVIIAERSESSTEKDTRNGVGKTTLLEIINFCLGSRATKNTGLMIDDLESWIFTLEITLRGSKVKVSRAIANQNRIIVWGSTEGWKEQPDLDEETGERFFKIDKWKFFLGWAIFDLPHSLDQLPYKPSYRSLISYFLRLGPDAYTSPFRHFRQQKTWDIQLHTAYILGMNWEYAARWQELKDQEEGAKALEKAIKTGAIEGIIGSIGELEAQKIQLEEQATKVKKALDTFKVHPQYESIQKDANNLTSETHELVNQNVIDNRRLKQYQDSIKEEKPPTTTSLEQLYEESGVVLSDTAKITLKDAKTFHQNIISNRREFLKSEIAHIGQRIDDRNRQIQEKTDQRANIIQILQEHGALQEMTKLQEMYVVLQEKLQRVQTQLGNLKNLTAKRREAKAAKTDLIQSAERDHEERRSNWSEVVRLFNKNSQALYESPGKLIIDVADTGYTYQVDIERSGSEGIDKMKIFCYDLAVLQFQMQREQNIKFLIHDTSMYDAVDTRQRALAFERAHEVMTALGGQYICTINSDMVPTRDFSDDFDFEKCVRLTLSDATPSKSLLGIRFERTGK